MAKVTIGSGIEAKTQLETKWREVRQITESVLQEFRALGARQVNLRLNQSQNEEKLPIFIDWIALPSVTAGLANRCEEKDVGRWRLGEPTPSKVYDAGLAQAGRRLIERNWKVKRLLKEKRVESKLAVQKAGLMYQRFIGILAEEAGAKRRAGLLTVSFKNKPRNLKEIDKRMKKWASWPGHPKSPLVKYMEENFVLGGPLFK